MNPTVKVNTINNWIKRRLDKGIRPNADEIDQHIRELWPTLSDVEREQIFQRTK
jgi:hypothetical protein